MPVVPDVRNAIHHIDVSAPAERVYDLLADVTNWPRIFPPTVHVRRLDQSGDEERIRIWATANGEAKSWTSLRRLDPAARRIRFRQEVSQPPVAGMSGEWLVEPVAGAGCTVTLLHEFTAVGDEPENIAWIEQAVDRNSTAELAALKSVAEATGGGDELLVDFTDEIFVAGARADVYDFLYDAGRWQERLPHVARVDLTEGPEGVQLLTMDTRTKDGSTHSTTSVRVCFSPAEIVYKQVRTPALMTMHTGSWTLREVDGGTLAASRHTVVIAPEAVTAVLGEGKGVEDARAFVRTALSGNSLATLGLAKAYAERR